MTSSGTVKFFNDRKGFGFITPLDGSEDVFVHARDLSDNNVPLQDDQVTYDVSFDDRSGKTKACNVHGGTGGPRQMGGGKGKGKGGFGGGGGFGGFDGGYGGGYGAPQMGGYGGAYPGAYGQMGGGGGYGGGFGGGKGKGGGGGVCRQFQAGHCSYGESCRFAHVQ